MKKLITICAALLVAVSVFAQAPEKMSYQAVIRNNVNALVTNTAVGMKISILQGSASGTVVYAETQTPSTNANGLVSLEIGTGAVVSGTFATINWANGLYFIKTETDQIGGTTYTITGITQLMSVPYALYAKTSAFPNVELSVSIVSPQQTVTGLNGTTTFNTLNYNSGNSSNASLTGGNTWNGTTFNVGSNGAGWYVITATYVGVASGSNSNSVIGAFIALDKNNAFGTSPAAGTYPIVYSLTTTSSSNTAILRNSSGFQATIYLSANDYLNIRAQSVATAAVSYSSTNGTTNWQIVRIK